MEVDDLIVIKPGELRCARCFSKDVVHSLPRGVIDTFMRSAFDRVPRQCRYCGRRFYVRRSALPPDTE